MKRTYTLVPTSSEHGSEPAVLPLTHRPEPNRGGDFSYFYIFHIFHIFHIFSYFFHKVTGGRGTPIVGAWHYKPVNAQNSALKGLRNKKWNTASTF